MALDVRLFELHGKRLVPTDAALALLPVVHEVFAAFERCERRLSDLRTPVGSQARIESRRLLSAAAHALQ